MLSPMLFLEIRKGERGDAVLSVAPRFGLEFGFSLLEAQYPAYGLPVLRGNVGNPVP